MLTGRKERECEPDSELTDKIRKKAQELGKHVREGRVYTSDVFYADLIDNHRMYEEYHLLCAEMESYALFVNAKYFHKKAACILTISDNMITHQETTSEQRQNSFHEMVLLALESCL